MTDSRGPLRPAGASTSLPARFSSQSFGSTFVGWLFHTALIAVVEGTCETFYETRGSTEGLRPSSSTRFAFPLKFYHGPIISKALLSRALGRESTLCTTGYVAGRRRRRRAVTG